MSGCHRLNRTRAQTGGVAPADLSFHVAPCHVMLETLMVQLCGDAEQGTFYQLQNPLYQSLLSPTLGIDSMVSDDRDSLVLLTKG